MRSSAFIAAALAGTAFAWPWDKSQFTSTALPPSNLPLPQGLAPVSGSSGTSSKPYYSTGSGAIYPTASVSSGSAFSHTKKHHSTGTGNIYPTAYTSHSRKHHTGTRGILPSGGTGVGTGSGIFPPGPTATGTSGGSGGPPSKGVPPPSTTTITSDVTSTITTFTTGVTTITNTISESPAL